MASENDIILNLPFDEGAGSAVAYDYSSSRTDGVVTGAQFVSGGKSGNCLKLPGNGKCEVDRSSFPLSGNFTLLAWLKREAFPDGFTGKKIGIQFACSGVNSFTENWYTLNADTWGYWAIVKQGLQVKIYLDTQLIDTVQLPSQPTGFGIIQDIYSYDLGYGYIDQCVIYEAALTQSEIEDLLSNVAQLAYSINGQNFIEGWGIYVSDSAGLLDRPALKDPLKIEWDDYHGEVVDLNEKRLQAREITLNCWMKAESKIAFAQKLNDFLGIFQQDGTQRLQVDIHPTKPLLYEVYAPSGVAIAKRWSDSLMVGTFSLKLREPDPVKRVVRFQRVGATVTLSITLTTTKLVTIYWGDGTSEADVSGSNITKTHTYTEDGIYYAVIAGVIEKITAFSTNGILVWSKL